MTTTLTEARTALIKLSSQFPAPSTYATLLSQLSDYFDNQVPLNVENRALTQRIAILESTLSKIREALPGEVATLARIPPDIPRKPIECTSWMGLPGCACMACRVRQHA